MSPPAAMPRARSAGVDHGPMCLRLLRGAERRGLPAAPLLERAGIPATLATQPVPIKAQQFIRLLSVVQRALQDEYFGFTAQPCRPGTYALVMEMALHCDTLGAAMAQSVRLYNHIAPGLCFGWTLQGDEAAVSVQLDQPELDPDGFLTEYWLLYWQRSLSWLTGCLLQPRRVELCSTEPPGPARVAALLRGDWQAGAARNALVLSAKLAELPILRSRTELHEHLRRGRTGTPVWPADDRSIGQRVRGYLLRHWARTGQWPSLTDTMAELNLTGQTLRRRLREEGTGFGELRDALRRELAIEKLQVQGLRVEDVAAQLGFAETRSFSRAFREWTGSPPSRYQRR